MILQKCRLCESIVSRFPFGRRACGQEENFLQNLQNDTGNPDEKGMLPLWQQMQREGAVFYVEGKAVSASEAVSRAVREDGAYMADYVFGAEGKVEQVRLDRVNPE